jgi:Ca2+-transporting ATPase
MTNVSVVCTDKTGALTQNCMTVVAGSVGIHAKFVRNLEANTTCTNESSPRKHANDFSLDLSQLNTVLEPQLRELFNEAIAVNSTAFQDKHPETGEPIFVGSQTEAALLQFAQELQWPELRTTRGAAAVVQMIPFSSERKVMGVVVRTPRGKFRLHLKGASEILSNKCVRHVVVRKEGPSARDPTEEIETAAIDELANDNTGRTTIFYANQTLRTIALCYRDLDSWPTRDEVHSTQHLPTSIFMCLTGFIRGVSPEPDSYWGSWHRRPSSSRCFGGGQEVSDGWCHRQDVHWRQHFDRPLYRDPVWNLLARWYHNGGCRVP